MTGLSPAAYAVLSAVTQRKYSLDPEDIPRLAASIRSGVSIALRAAAARNEAVEIRTAPGTFEFDQVIRVSDLLAIADELEAQ